MGRLIDADALVAEFKQLSLGENSLIERIFADGVYAVIETAPTVDAVPVVHGRPVQVFNDPCTGRMITTCMMCDGKVSKKDAYCKHCGARMDLERSKDV